MPNSIQCNKNLDVRNSTPWTQIVPYNEILGVVIPYIESLKVTCANWAAWFARIFGGLVNTLRWSEMHAARFRVYQSTLRKVHLSLCLAKTILCDFSMWLHKSQECTRLLRITWRSQSLAQFATAMARCEAKSRKYFLQCNRCDPWTVVTSPPVPHTASRLQPTTGKSWGDVIKEVIN